MLLLVGLGNPGEKYARQRHNVGFMAVDAIADRHGFSPPRSKFLGEIRDGFLDGPNGRVKALILKPLTYMNESGRSVSETARFYKIPPEDVIVFHDELDLAPGKLRVKTGGGNAGHNGLRSIDAHLGNGFRRVRIGIGHPGDKARVTAHVLGDFSKADQDWLTPFFDAIAAAAPSLGDDDARFVNDVALRLQPPSPTKGDAKDSVAPTKDDKPRAADAPLPRGPLADVLQKLFGRKD
ncbi:MAG: aminoacyl-tRNA hydrolase [Parvularculaceae bacterium]